tara:strand:- start:1504 stop:2439 length:936 start_codon:yes stop_codon:yes gene_type:complete
MLERIVLLFFFISACNIKDKTFLGGKILNKTSNSISIYKDNTLVNESKISNDGLFTVSLDNISSGLYSFYHEPEFQYIIIDENDSLQIRINTLDFDESLVYSGIGSSKNNFLMDLFLKTEKDEIKINSNINLNLKDFKNLVDSLYNKQFDSYSEFKKSRKLSLTSKTIIENAILYPYISKFHSYIIRNNVLDEKQINLFDNYYDEINYNLDELAFFKPYIDFLYLEIYNQVKNNSDYNSALDFNIKRLNYTNEIIKSEIVKLRVFRFHAIGFLLQREEEAVNKKFLDSFLEISQNTNLNDEIVKLYNDLKY